MRTDEILAPIIATGRERLRAVSIADEPMDDATNSALFSRAYKGFVRSVNGAPWIYNTRAGMWVLDNDRSIVRRLAIDIGRQRYEAIGFSSNARDALRWATYSLSASGIRNMLELAVSEPDLVAGRDDFDVDPDAALDAAGQHIDLPTGSARPATPEDGFTHALGAVYDPDATCPLWERFLLESFSGDLELVLFHQRWRGYCLTARTTEQVALIAVGNGGNGKSIESSVCEAVMGGYGRTLSSTLFAPQRGMSSPAYELAELPGVRAAFIRETPPDGQWDEAMFKACTGETSITARAPYQRPFTFVPVAKDSFETNCLPRVRTQNVAMWRRMLVERWDNTPAAPDPRLREKLLAELPGILTWAVRGAMTWYQFGLQPPESVTAAIKEYRDGEDTLKEFTDSFRRDPAASIAAGDLYAQYRSYAETNGLKQMSAPAFKDAMRERGFTHRHTATGSRFYGLGDVV